MKAETYKTALSSCRQLRFGDAWRRMSLALLLLLLTTLSTWADDSWTSGDCTVTLTGSTLTVSKTVPSSTTGAMANYSSSDQQPWKDFKYEIESLVIKKGVTSIGNYAFAGCACLESVTYEAVIQLTTIGASAFEGCSSLAAVYIPSSVTTIGNNAFANCYYQNVFVCPDTPPTLGENVFGEYYPSIDFIVRSNSYTTTTGWKDLSNMTVGDANNFNIPYIDAEGNTFICPYAVPIPSGNFTWQDNGDLWFYISGKDEVESYLDFDQWDWGTINLIICDDAERTIKYLNSNKTLNIYGQKNNTGKLTIVNNFYGKGIYAEYGLTICGGIIEVSNAPNGVSSSGDITINGGKITVTGASTDGGIYSSSGNITINGGKITSTATGNASGIYSFSGNVTINGGEIISSATGYGIYSTSGSITLGDATITASSYQVGSSIKIADGLTLSDGTDAYSGTLYDGTGNGKFEDLDALNTALANKTLKKLPAYIDLTATIVWNDNKNQSDKRPASVTVSLKGNGTQIGTYELTEDENGEWKYTVNKPSLSNGTLIVYTWDVPNMPNGYGLTGNSTDGTTTTLTLTLQQCGENVAWNYDASSKTLTISGSGAMDGYSSTDDQPWSSFSNEIESLVINKDVTSIGSYAFAECTKLESVTYEAESRLGTIGSNAFDGCSSLTSINIPAGVTSIEGSAFADCENLGTVTYAAGTKLETIGENAFAVCSSLASVIIPVGVTSIGARAFDGCTSLTSVTAYPQTPPALGAEAFKDINENVAFTVRNDSYETAPGWIAWASKMTILDPSQFLPYIDANGNEAFCTNATKITSNCMYYGGTDEEDDLWYYVDGTVDISNYIQFQDFSGSTNIILCDGASLTVKYLEANNAINIYRQGGNTPGKITTTGYNNGEYGLYSGYGGLSIYGGTIEISGSTNGIFSSGGNITIANCNITISDKGGFTAWANYWGGGDILINSGNITITDGNIYASKGENEYGKGGNITINGGEITIKKGQFSSSGGNILINDGTITVEGDNGFVSNRNVTINAGEITVTATGSHGISADGNITINGGTVTAKSTNGAGIYANDITLAGGTIEATSKNGAGIFVANGKSLVLAGAIFTASSYGLEYESGSIKITDGLFMTDGSTAYSGTLFDGSVYPSIGKFASLDALNAALEDKTLQPVPDYIDLKARIVWNDNNDQYNKRPTSVAVSLMADGVKVESATYELNETGEWNCTVPNQPSLKEGELIEYTWEVYDVSGWYELSESAEATTTTLTFSTRQCGQEGSDVIWCYDPDMKTITISGTGYMMYYNSIQNENGWSNGAPWKDFANEIEAVVIENGITYVGSNTFAHCPKISSVTLPTDGIYEIGPGAFADCTSLTSIDIPMSINKIGDQAFAGCSSLATVTIDYGEASSFTIGTEVFPATAVIIVPEASLSGYQTATGWSTYQIVPATRTFFAANSSNQWMTWCDKNEYTKPEGVTVYTVSGVDDNTVTLAEVSDVIPAYTPVLLYRSTVGSDAVKAVFNAVGTAPQGYNGFVETTGSGNATFLGIPGDEPYASGSNNNIYAISDFGDTQSYVLHNGNFVAVDEDGGIAPHRCWLNVTKSITNNAPRLRITMDGETTSMDNGQLTMDNGQWTMDNWAGAWYTLEGRKLDSKPTKKGVYINNGKKYIIK